MLSFQSKVESLRSCESITYTICLNMLQEDGLACAAAEKVLCKLFQDSRFWELQEHERRPYILRQCFTICTALARTAKPSMQASS